MPKIRALVLSLSLVLGVSCTREELKDASKAMRPKASGPITDDLDYAGLAEGLVEQSAWLRRQEKPLQFGPRTVTPATYADRLDGLIAALADGSQATYLKEQFETYEVYGAQSWGEVKLTSYFEPLLKGAKAPTAEFPEPVLRRPDDLLTIQTSAYPEPIKSISSMRGRVDPTRPTRIIPYFSRQEIYEGALKDRGLELIYLDPIDAFFMQIQGSGTVELDDGSTVRLGYADQNGHPYVAIGKFLLDVIAKDEMSMERIVAHLRTATPARRTELLASNPSYVFFESRTGPALTANTTAVVPGRTIATDARFFPKGTIAILTFEVPTESGDTKQVSRLVIDQDTGGAIRGGGRADLFWGQGPQAGKIAGAINQTARLLYLVPK